MTARQKPGRRVPKYEDDPMVTILPARLRAAIDWRGLGHADVARRLGPTENRQTLHHLTKGDEPKRSRLSRRKQLAKVLRVPEEWLGGKPIELPFIPSTDLVARAEGSPRVSLAIADLLRRCVVACQRDLKSFRAEPAEGEFFTPADEVIGFLAGAIYGLVDASRWLYELTGWTDPSRKASPEARAYEAAIEAQVQLSQTSSDAAAIHAAGVRAGEAARRLRGLPMTPAEEAATVSLVNAFGIVLEPWLRGNAPLRYDRLVGIMRGFALGADLIPPNSLRPDVIVTASGTRFSPDDPRTPFIVVNWPKPSTQPRRGKRNHGTTSDR